jgi:D-alanine-D-alanine ligase
MERSEVKKLNIGLTYDLRREYLAAGYSEEDVAEFDSEETIDFLHEALSELGHQVERVGHVWALAEALVAGRRWDLVYNIAEGLGGRSREAQVPSLLEAFGIPYTYSDPLVCAVTLDKAVAKRLVAGAGLATPAYAVIREATDLEGLALAYPLFAKPLAEGTGKGITQNSLIENAADLRGVVQDMLRRYRQSVLVEEYLPGREFTTAILGTGGKARVLGTMEVSIARGDGQTVYTYENKELCEQYVSYTRPSGAIVSEVEQLALASYLALECRDAGRVDIRCDRHGRASFMEINPLPGIHPHHSDLPMIATQEGMSYRELIGRIVASAVERIEHAGKEQGRGPLVRAHNP